MKEYIRINTIDNVAVALTDLPSGKEVTIGDIVLVLKEDIPKGHKFALKDIAGGEAVIKYGNSIGNATANIEKGSWIHTHNLKTGLGDLLTYKYHPENVAACIGEASGASGVNEETCKSQSTDMPSGLAKTFKGYRRADGKVGIRNEIWIIPTVGCVNKIVSSIEKRASHLIGDGVEDIIAFNHPYGCSQMGDDQENTRKVLADLINHPNAAGVLVMGLGCENSNIEVLKTYLGEIDDNRVKFIVAQESEDEIEDGLRLVEELVSFAKKAKREDIDVSELIIGMKCGGSDGLSGITANPTVGIFSDLLVANGGSTILTEVPEMFGAEQGLMDRCETSELFEKTVKLINDFKEYFKSHNQTIYENPSPGNKKGGISTLEDKSLGCTQKSGSAKIRGVLDYGEELKAKGLNLLSSPGNDLVAATALAVSGAHMVLFTTGRGTPFACPVPTVKISTNNYLNEHKNNWIDFNAGSAVDGKSIEDLGKELYEYVIKVASGEKVKSELAGLHDLAIFKGGVTL